MIEIFVALNQVLVNVQNVNDSYNAISYTTQSE